MESSDPESDLSFYKIISHQANTEIKVKGSRFIAHADPASNQDQCEEVISHYRKTYHNATHVCFAYRVGINEAVFYHYSDAGEPAGTAGSPIYNVIKGSGLTNVIVLVIRYFGGTKLGIGGLIRAYTTAAQTVLQAAEIVQKGVTTNLHFQISYEYLNQVIRELSVCNSQIIHQNYSDIIQFVVSVPKQRLKKIRENLINLCSGNVEFISESDKQ